MNASTSTISLTNSKFFVFAFLRTDAPNLGQSNLDLAYYISLAPTDGVVETVMEWLTGSADEVRARFYGFPTTKIETYVLLSKAVKRYGVKAIKFCCDLIGQRQACAYLNAFAYCLPEDHLIRKVHVDLEHSLERRGFGNTDPDALMALYQTGINLMNQQSTTLFIQVSRSLISIA